MKKKKDQPTNPKVLFIIGIVIIFAIAGFVGWTTITGEPPETTPIPGFNETATAYVEQDAAQQAEDEEAFSATATALIEQDLSTEVPDDE